MGNCPFSVLTRQQHLDIIHNPDSPISKFVKINSTWIFIVIDDNYTLLSWTKDEKFITLEIKYKRKKYNTHVPIIPGIWEIKQ